MNLCIHFIGFLIEKPRCDFITSNHDAQGGSEVKVGSNITTVDDCITLAMQIPYANGMTYMSDGSKDCYAEINATEITTNYGCSTIRFLITYVKRKPFYKGLIICSNYNCTLLQIK